LIKKLKLEILAFPKHLVEKLQASLRNIIILIGKLLEWLKNEEL
jgi:hypothetical protein